MERKTVLVAPLAGLTEGSLEEFTKVKAHPSLAFAPENSSLKLFLLHIIPSLSSLR